jgi:hypothetical protein
LRDEEGVQAGYADIEGNRQEEEGEGMSYEEAAAKYSAGSGRIQAVRAVRKMLDFEMLKLPAPKGWDAVLRRHYGDYMLIPENKNGSFHGSVEFDPETPYTEYFKNKR